MLAVIAIILLILWGGGLAFHLGSFIYILLVAAIIVGIAHFVTGGKNKSAI